MLHHRLRAASGARGGGGGGIPTDGLIAWYTMDNISGSTLIDEQGTYDGTIAGSVQDTGVIGQALSFDGTTSDEVDLGVLGLTDATISMWVYLNTLAPAQQPVISNWAGGTPSSYMLDVVGGNYRWLTYTGSSAYIRSTVASSGVWQHIVVYSVDGTSGLILNDGTPITGTSVADLRNTANNVYLGRKEDEPIPRLNGLIDQLRIYNRQLTSEEITALYNEV